MSPVAPAAPTIVVTPLQVGGGSKPHQSSHSPPIEGRKGDIKMSPKDVLVYLQIAELSAKSPQLAANITGPAMEVLKNVQLDVGKSDDDEKETPSSKKGSR